MESLIRIRNLHIQFGGTPVLQGVDLDLNPGENLVVLGKSGTGKSVLIKCIVGLLLPDQGEICINDKNVLQMTDEELAEVRQRIGFLFQSGALYDSMSVRENLAFPLIKVQKLTETAEINEKIERALEEVGLPDAIDKMPSELSGGMRKRIGLARTLIVEPEIILYDEPTTGLDPITATEISQLINQIQRKRKSASIIITHDIPCAREVGDRFIMLDQGKVRLEGSWEDFQQQSEADIKVFVNY